MPPELIFVPIILVLLVISGFFSGSETALTATSRTRIAAMIKQGRAGADRVSRLRDEPERLIGAILLGNNVVNILASLLAGQVVAAHIDGPLGLATATVVMTVLVLVFAEVLPKTYAISNADRMAIAVSRPIAVIVRVLSPLVAGVQAIVRATLGIFGVKSVDSPLSLHDEIRGAIDFHVDAEDAPLTEDKHMLGGILDLRDLTVEDVMVHRSSIETLDADLPIEAVVAQAMESRYTRIPIWRGEPEDIIGVLHAKDLARAIVANPGNLSALCVDDIALEPTFVPETNSLLEQLNSFRSKREHFALVVDEYGALMGLVTLEDILEEIVGEIEDEHDEPLAGVEKLSEGVLRVAGSVSIRDLNREMGWDLPDQEAVTIAGLIIHAAKTIPNAGQQFKFHNLRFEIVARERNQLTQLKILVPPEGPTGEQ